MTVSYSQLEARVAEWAELQENVRAVLVIGSRAWAQDQVDHWSDLDLVVFTAQPSLYWRDLAWLQEIGDCWVSVAKPPFDPTSSWLPVSAVFSDRLRVDFVFHSIPDNCSASSSLGEIITASPYAYVFYPFTRVLFDRGGSPGVLTMPGGEYRPSLPDQPAFANHLKLFWLQAVHIAHLIQRGELWRADQILHCELRRNLLALIEWHAMVMQGLEVGILPRGRFLEKWADPRVPAALSRDGKTGGATALREELDAICRLARSLAGEIAEGLGSAVLPPELVRLDQWLVELAGPRDSGGNSPSPSEDGPG